MQLVLDLEVAYMIGNTLMLPSVHLVRRATLLPPSGSADVIVVSVTVDQDSKQSRVACCVLPSILFDLGVDCDECSSSWCFRFLVPWSDGE